MFKREGLMSEERRQFIKGSAALAAGSALPAGAWAAGSDAPEKKEVRIGFIPLTDCASVVMASVLKFDEKYGIKIIPTKEASLGRRARQAGQRRARHGACAVRPGLRRAPGRRRAEEGHGRADDAQQQRPGDHAVARSWPTRARSMPRRWPRLMAAEKREYTFAQTFPTGTHAMWLYYWLASRGHQPDEGRQGHHRAAAADGGQHARRQHGRLLRRRALEPPRHHRRHRHHRGHHAGHLEGPPREGAGHAPATSSRRTRTPRAP